MTRRFRLRATASTFVVITAVLTMIVGAESGVADAAVVNQPIACGAGGNQTMRIDATHPATVDPGGQFEVTLAPQSGTASGSDIKNLAWYFEMPVGTTIVGNPTLVGSGSVSSGTLGATSASASGRIVKLSAAGTVKNGATFKPPAVRIVLKASSTAGADHQIRVQASPAYSLTAAIGGGIPISCTTSGTRQSLTTTKVNTPATTTTTAAPSETTTTVPAESTIETFSWSPTECGTTETVTAPPHAVSVTVTAKGGRGGKGGGQGGGSGAVGGDGSFVTATFPAQPGETYSANTGCNGRNGGSFDQNEAAKGYATGGVAGRGYVIIATRGASGGNGGAATGICLGDVCEDDPITEPLVIAGGGGGGGVSNCAGTDAGAGGFAGSGTIASDATGSGPSGLAGEQGRNSGLFNGGPGGPGGVNGTGGEASGGNGTDPGPTDGGGLSSVGGAGGAGRIGGAAGANEKTGCKGGGGGGGGSSWVADGASGVDFSTATEAGATLTFTSLIPPVCNPDIVPFGTAEDLVRQQYRDFSGREASAAEVAAAAPGIANCTLDADNFITTLVPTDQLSTDAKLVRVYYAFYQRPPDRGGFEFWEDQLDNQRKTVGTVAQRFATLPEFRNRYGSLSDAGFVDLIYRNVLDRAPDAEGRAFWVGRLSQRNWNRGKVMTFFSEANENRIKRRPLVDSFRVHRAMMRSFPNASTMSTITAPRLAPGREPLSSTIELVRKGAGYADRF